MAKEESEGPSQKLASVGLPWLVGAGGLLVYLATLNPWISLHSLDLVDQVDGPVWQPAVTQPLTWAVMFMFRIVPETLVPLALNVFSAVCAALILVWLARTVALLPYHRASDERSYGENSLRLAGWMPPVLAAVAFGLELTFWEQATAISGEMIDLVVYALIIGCLFEFRAGGKQGWLSVAALLEGAGMANNWGMIGFFPAFLAAVIWVKGMSFFNGRFLWRMGLCWAAGLSLYLWLPLAHSFSQMTLADFWPSLRTNLRYQTEILLDFPEGVFWLLALTSLVPALVITICRLPHKKEEGGDNEVATFMGRASLRLAHGLFLVLAVWIALDLPFSPRKIGLGQPLLSYYYVNALVLGYCARYFLLTGLGRFRGDSPFSILVKLLAKIGAYWVCVLVVALPVEMGLRNLSEIRLTNGPSVRRFAEQLYSGLPPGKSVALSDSPEQLILARAALAAHGGDKSTLLVDLTALPLAQYQTYMARKIGARWPALPQTKRPKIFDRAALKELVAKFAAQETLVCLNPGFGYYQEPFLDEPRGLVHYLVARPAKGLSGLHLDAAGADANEQFWQEQWADGMEHLATLANPPPRKSIFMRSLIGRAFLAREQNLMAASLRNAYSRALNDWGVQLQRLGRWQQAGVWFQRALDLKADNLSARINQLYNLRHARGITTRLDQHEIESQLRDQFGKYATWGRVILDSGPVDEPTFLNETARVLLFENNNHQAASDYARCAELAPDWPECKVWFAQSLLAIRDFDGVLGLNTSLQNSTAALDPMMRLQLHFCDVCALQGLGRTNEATRTIEQFARAHSDQDLALSTAVDLCIRTGNFAMALSYLDQLLDRLDQVLQRDPRSSSLLSNKAELLSNKGFVEMKLSRNQEALATLTAATALAPTNQVFRLNRALALLDSGELDAARGDYLEALRATPNSKQAIFGLAEIAWRKKDLESSIRFCEQYLANGNPESFEYNLVSNRLRSLKARAKN